MADTLLRSYRYRIYPTRRQVMALEAAEARIAELEQLIEAAEGGLGR